MNELDRSRTRKHVRKTFRAVDISSIEHEFRASSDSFAHTSSPLFVDFDSVAESFCFQEGLCFFSVFFSLLLPKYAKRHEEILISVRNMFLRRHCGGRRGARMLAVGSGRRGDSLRTHVLARAHCSKCGLCCGSTASGAVSNRRGATRRDDDADGSNSYAVQRSSEEAKMDESSDSRH